MKLTRAVLIILAAASIGCKDNDTPTSNAFGSSLVGDLKGQIVYLLDSNERYLTDLSGVTVQVDGTTYSGVSDTSGIWIIHNLPTRTYSLTFSKPGFMTTRNTSYSFLGGGTVWYGDNTILMEPPIVNLALDAILFPDSISKNEGSLFGHFAANTPDSISWNVIMLFGHTPNLDVENPQTYVCLAYGSAGPFAKSDNLKSYENTSWIQRFTGFNSGDTVYVAAYPYYFLQSYFDVQTAKTLYLGYGKQSNVLSTVVP